MSATYEIVTVTMPHLGRRYAVVETVDGVCRGADHHWLFLSSAANALKAYEAGIVAHGAPAQEVVDSWDLLEDLLGAS